ncbi:MAG: twin transmembrane helix small protein [Xanthomonadales bacterium]|nr:twin transmembrane helix small protein [Xanthomonadales bacterium]
MAIKILIIVFLLTIVYSLGSALFFLVNDHGEGDRTVRRLTWRIALSLFLLLLLWLFSYLGWIEPNRGPIGLQLQEQSAPAEE